ncbi:MAG: transglutaminase domain-containing protein [Pyrinomonadaceae bacterium]|nr:transglutaminase domain-containing protein [Phycisphaerales bacterium]
MRRVAGGLPHGFTAVCWILSLLTMSIAVECGPVSASGALGSTSSDLSENSAHPDHRLGNVLLESLGSREAVFSRMPQASVPSIDFDRWYTLELQGSHAGWAHAVQTTTAGSVSTKLTQHLQIRRAGQTVMLESESEFVESAGGQPVSLTIVESLAAQPTTTAYLYTEQGISRIVTQGTNGTRRSSTYPPIKGTWLTPAAASVFVAQRLAAGATEIAVRTVELGAGPDPVLITRKVIEKTQAQSLGKALPAYKVAVSSSRQGAATSTELIDERGAIIRSVIRMGQLQLTMTLTTAADAQSRIDPPELLGTMLVKANRAIAQPRQATKATYILKRRGASSTNDGRPTSPPPPSPDSPGTTPTPARPDLPVEPSLASRVCTTSIQAIQEIDENSVRVIISTNNPSPAPEADLNDPQYLRSSAYIGSDDAEVQRLARQVAPRAADNQATKAESVRRFVYDYIVQKDLGVGFATAAEVAQAKSGDCTEHAVLVAAMLRSLKIPSRVVSGLVYVDAVGMDKHVFAYHMWTQGLIERNGVSHWVDLDATLPPGRACDATHIALLTSPLNDDQPQESLVKLVPLLGGLSVEVVSVGLGR